VALLGPNGAGKTTLVEMIEGIQHPDKGEIQLFGKFWKGNEDLLHRNIGLSLQETKFFDKVTVEETLRVFATFYQLDFSRVEEILRMVNLIEKRKSFTVNLSGGQRQKLALGIALLNSPKILLLDEPTTGLDPVARREIWCILTDLKHSQGTSLILTTHYMEEAEFLCDRIVILFEGKILSQGTLQQLLSDNNFGEMVEFSVKETLTDLNFSQFKSELIKKAIWDINTQKGKVIVNDIVSFLPIFSDFIKNHNLTLSNFECRKMTLDDLFIAMTGRKLDE